MKIIHHYEDLPLDNPIHFTHHERKPAVGELLPLYRRQVTELKKSDAVTVVEVAPFSIALKYWDLGTVTGSDTDLYFPQLSDVDYADFYKGADYLILTPLEYAKAVYTRPDVLAIKDQVDAFVRKNYRTMYRLNHYITVRYFTFFQIYRQLFNLPIVRANSSIECGARTYFYEDYFANQLGIAYSTVREPRDKHGFLLVRDVDRIHQLQRRRLKDVNDILMTTDKNNINVSEDRIRRYLDAVNQDDYPCSLEFFTRIDHPLGGPAMVEVGVKIGDQRLFKLLKDWK